MHNNNFLSILLRF